MRIYFSLYRSAMWGAALETILLLHLFILLSPHGVRALKVEKCRMRGHFSLYRSAMWGAALETILFLHLFILLSPHGVRALKDFEEVVTSRTLKQEVGQRHEVHCSRERSRAAWKAIEEYLIPFVDEEQYQLPKKCRLNPENDMFRDQEQHKVHVETNEWRCGYCKKSFRAEKFLDQHFDNRHYNLLNDSHGRCLADLCGALHCDFVTDSKKTKTKCNPAAAARSRHLCESLADSCFPLNKGQSASRLHEFFLRQFCDAHTCTGGKRPFSRGGKKESSVFYLAVCILVVMLLPLFYTVVYLHQREMKNGVQVLKRISKPGLKTKPS